VREPYSTFEAFAQDAFAQDAFAQEAELQDALDQEALDQEAELQEALDHEALDQDAELHDACEIAVEYHAPASNSGLPVALWMETNSFRLAFGLGTPEAFRAAEPLTTPTPIAPSEL
jgi:hypothetical protein